MTQQNDAEQFCARCGDNEIPTRAKRHPGYFAHNSFFYIFEHFRVMASYVNFCLRALAYELRVRHPFP